MPWGLARRSKKVRRPEMRENGTQGAFLMPLNLKALDEGQRTGKRSTW